MSPALIEASSVLQLENQTQRCTWNTTWQNNIRFLSRTVTWLVYTWVQFWNQDSRCTTHL